MKTVFTILLLSFVSFSVNAKTAPNLTKACAKEIKKFCAKEKGDTNIYNCLEKHDSEISKSCDAVHEAYGLANGLEKKGDK